MYQYNNEEKANFLNHILNHLIKNLMLLIKSQQQNLAHIVKKFIHFLFGFLVE